MLISETDVIFLPKSGERENSKDLQNASLELARELFAYLIEENFKISTILAQSHDSFVHAVDK